MHRSIRYATHLATAALVLGLTVVPARAAGAEPAQDQSPQKQAEPEGFWKSTFLRWLHTDAFWIPSESGHDVRGIVGVHLAIARIGRINIFGPPGFMLVMEGPGGARLARGARTWGTSIYLIDFRVPGSRKMGQLYVNIGKAWTSGDYHSSTSVNMVGLSATWKK